jgi:L-ascorbate metabolism protein UlaG (beta-lactamase superfamily)
LDRSILYRWLGVAGIELTVEGQTLVIDPFLTRPPVWRIWFGRVEPNRELAAEKIKHCDHILVTHAHFDHVMDVPEVVRTTGALALGSANTCQLLAACGVPEEQIREVGAGDVVELGSFRVDVLPAEHMGIPGFMPGPLSPHLQPPLRLRDYRMDGCYSFLIEVEGHRLLDWCGVRSGPAPRAEVLFVRPGERRAYYEALLRAVRPQVVIPVHWDDLFRPLSKPARPTLQPPGWTWPPLRRVSLARFRQMVESIAPQVRVLVPDLFEIYDLLSPERT